MCRCQLNFAPRRVVGLGLSPCVVPPCWHRGKVVIAVLIRENRRGYRPPFSLGRDYDTFHFVARHRLNASGKENGISWIFDFFRFTAAIIAILDMIPRVEYGWSGLEIFNDSVDLAAFETIWKPGM